MLIFLPAYHGRISVIPIKIAFFAELSTINMITNGYLPLLFREDALIRGPNKTKMGENIKAAMA